MSVLWKELSIWIWLFMVVSSMRFLLLLNLITFVLERLLLMENILKGFYLSKIEKGIIELKWKDRVGGWNDLRKKFYGIYGN